LKSLSDFDYLNPLKQNRRKRSSRTAKWIFETPEYLRWRNGLHDRGGLSLLWCYGKIGSGKTILLTSVIDQLLIGKDKPDDLVAFFFPRFDNDESLQAETILRSIAVQFLNSSSLSGDAMNILGTVESAPSFDAYHFMILMKSVFKPAKRFHPQTFYIIIDGIDECEQKDMDTLLRTLSSVESITSETHEVRVLVACRHRRPNSIADLFPHVEDICASAGPATSDIAVFIDDEIQGLEASGELVVGDRNIIQDIKRFLFQHADGMFLWATLALREICHQRCDEDIREVLTSQNLPRGLPELFTRSLSRIVSQDNEKITRKILPWIIAPRQPLTLDQIAESALVEILQTNAHPGRRINGIHHIGAWFNGLVEVDEERKTVHFAHASVRHFLLGSPVKRDLGTFHMDLDNANHHLGEICVTYLHFTNFQTALAQRRREMAHFVPKDIAQSALAQEWSSSTTSKLGRLFPDTRLPSASENLDRAIVKLQPEAAFEDDTATRHPFLKYAASKWIFHTSSFNDKGSKTWAIWRNMLVKGHGVALSPVSGDVLPALNKELVNWAFDQRHAGLLSVLTSPEMREHIPAERIIGLSRAGDIELLSLVHGTTGFPPTILLSAIKAASRKGHVEVVELLISSVSDQHLLAQLRKQSLLCACGWGQLPLVNWLLSHGAIANPKVESGHRSPLQIASQYGHVEVMKLLFGVVSLLFDDMNGNAARAYIGTTSEGVRTAFITAVVNNQVDAAELLIHHGANVNESLGYESVLTIASGEGNSDMVRLLLREGASLRRVDSLPSAAHVGFDTHPLQAAASGSHLDIIKQLLDAGTSLIWGGEQALECAAASGEIELVKRLLSLSAVSFPLHLARGLHAAAKFNHCNIIKLLLDQGADINSAEFPTGKTALQTAIEFGHASTVEFLLRWGAEFPAYDAHLLIKAAKSRCDLAIINLLRSRSSSEWGEDFDVDFILITVEINSNWDMLRTRSAG
jgi:ankyrin repeat protein